MPVNLSLANFNFSAANANNFVVGLMETFDGTTWMDSGIGDYTLCARYPQRVASSLSYVVSCQDNPGAVQFVALIQDASTLPFAVCEIEVYGKYAIWLKHATLPSYCKQLLNKIYFKRFKKILKFKHLDTVLHQSLMQKMHLISLLPNSLVSR